MIEDKDLKSFLETVKELVVQYKGMIQGMICPGVIFRAAPSYVPNTFPVGSAFSWPDDGRKNKIISWIYNPRQLTFSFAVLLHEIGHMVLRHDLSNANIPTDLHDELEAWDWAIGKWPLVPLRTRFPWRITESLLDTHFRNDDPFVSEDFIELEDEFHGEEERLRNYNGGDKNFQRTYFS